VRENGKKNELRLNLEQGLFLKLSLLNVMGLNELKFYELIREIETSPLYKLLSGSAEGAPPAVARKRFPHAWELSLSQGGEAGATDLKYAFSDFTGGREGLINLIRKIGRLKFEKYFLHCEASGAEIRSATGLGKEAVGEIRDFVNSFLLAGDNAPVERLPAEVFRFAGAVSYERGRLLIEYASPFYSSGLYSINRDVLEALKLSPALKGKRKELGRLLLDISRVNFRKNALDIVLKGLCGYQKDYVLKKGGLKPLSMRGFSAAAGLDVSVVSRAVAGKYIKLPCGETVKIRSFFLSRKDFTMAKISDILEKKKKISDRELSESLLKKTGLKIPVRTVNYYRGFLRAK